MRVCGARPSKHGEKGSDNFVIRNNFIASPKLTTDRQVPAVLAVGTGRFFLPLFWPLFFGRKYREKDSPTHAVNNSRSPFPYLCTKKLSRTCCRGGSLFLPYPIQPHPLNPLIMARLKMTSRETFQFNMIKNTTKRYVDCNTVSWFSICRKTRLDSCAIPYLMFQICVALCLHERSTDFTHSSVRHFGFTI